MRSRRGFPGPGSAGCGARTALGLGAEIVARRAVLERGCGRPLGPGGEHVAAAGIAGLPGLAGRAARGDMDEEGKKGKKVSAWARPLGLRSAGPRSGLGGGCGLGVCGDGQLALAAAGLGGSGRGSARSWGPGGVNRGGQRARLGRLRAAGSGCRGRGVAAWTMGLGGPQPARPGGSGHAFPPLPLGDRPPKPGPHVAFLRVSVGLPGNWPRWPRRIPGQVSGRCGAPA